MMININKKRTTLILVNVDEFLSCNILAKIITTKIFFAYTFNENQAVIY